MSRAELLKSKLELVSYDPSSPPVVHKPKQLAVLPIKLEQIVVPGQPATDNAAYVLSTINTAVEGCLDNSFSAMVTGPVNKAIVNQAGFTFSGHTEYIASRCGNASPVMMLMNKDLKIALVTTHLPLASVPSKITHAHLRTVIRTVRDEMVTKFALPQPRLMVCGLNPHAGEQGYLGTEEIDVITPVLNQLREDGLELVGPVPADTAFTKESLRGMDIVICMYHDQGLPALKALGFGETVNVTLGLPLIRTSVDHGTALDLAGTGKAKDGSLLAAIEAAHLLYTRTQSA